MDSRRVLVTMFQQPANFLGAAFRGHLRQHWSISKSHLPLIEALALLCHNRVALIHGGTMIFLAGPVSGVQNA